MALPSNPTNLNRLAIALSSGRSQVGNNGDGNLSGYNATEGQGEPAAQYGPMQSMAPRRGAGGKPTYPPDHQPAMRVPQGGSMCANCKFLGDDKLSCKEPNFIKWNGSPVLPAPPDQFCSDWYMPGSALLTAPSGYGFNQVARPGAMTGQQPGSQEAGAGSNGPLQAPRTTLRSPGSNS